MTLGRSRLYETLAAHADGRLELTLPELLCCSVLRRQVQGRCCLRVSYHALEPSRSLANSSALSGCEPLTPEDIAEVIVFTASRRENVVIADSLILPSHQVRWSQCMRLGSCLLTLRSRVQPLSCTGRLNIDIRLVHVTIYYCLIHSRTVTRDLSYIRQVIRNVRKFLLPQTH